MVLSEKFANSFPQDFGIIAYLVKPYIDGRIKK
jgi:hypothetical protein